MLSMSGRVVSRPGRRDELRPGVLSPQRAESQGLDRVDLVEDQDARDVGELELLEHLRRSSDVLVLASVARVDDVEEQVGVGRLLEGRAEGGEEILRQVADEADRVGDDDLALAVPAQPHLQVRERVSSVAKSLSSARTSAPVSVLSSVLLPAFV